jgi:hypothetical protein
MYILFSYSMHENYGQNTDTNLRMEELNVPLLCFKGVYNIHSHYLLKEMDS